MDFQQTYLTLQYRDELTIPGYHGMTCAGSNSLLLETGYSGWRRTFLNVLCQVIVSPRCSLCLSFWNLLMNATLNTGQLHWLPVQRRVDFKLACFVFSSLSGQTPSYLADDIHLVSEGPRRRLRSSTDISCAVPRTHNTFGDRSFAVAGPRVWNSLPAHLHDEDITYMSFRRELKTYWFSCGRGAMWHSA